MLGFRDFNVHINTELSSDNASAHADLINSLSNTNLLDNAWFTINTRGNTSYNTTWSYTADRWIGGRSYSISIGDNGVTGTGDIYERLEPDLYSKLIGQTVTISVLLSDGRIFSNYGEVAALTIGPSVDNDFVHFGIGQDQYFAFVFLYLKTNTVTVRAVKLEVGNKSTLKLDTIPNYAIEVAKCRTSTADPENDRLSNQGDIGVGVSNPNILDNPWFTINQRGQSSYSDSTNQYRAVDRWVFEKELTVTVNSDDTISITNTATSDAHWFAQAVSTKDIELLEGDLITQSILLYNGNYYSHTATRPGNGSLVDKIINKDGLHAIQIQELNSDRYFCVYWINPNTTIRVKACKLERGGHCTVQYDTPPNYEEELIKCQRYFIRIATNNTARLNFNCIVARPLDNDSTKRYIYITGTLPATMASTPATQSNDITKWFMFSGINDTQATKHLITLNTERINDDNIFLVGTISNSSVTFGQYGQLWCDTADCYIDFNCEI